MAKNWLYQLTLGLVLICHSFYRNFVELFRDLFDMPISIGTVHNRLEAVTVTVAEINQSQDLSGIEAGLLNKIFQADKPVLVGVDAASTYCYLIQRVEHRVKRLGTGISQMLRSKASIQTTRLLMGAVVCGQGRKR